VPETDHVSDLVSEGVIQNSVKTRTPKQGSCRLQRELKTPHIYCCAKQRVDQVEPYAHDSQKQYLSSSCQVPKKK